MGVSPSLRGRSYGTASRGAGRSLGRGGRRGAYDILGVDATRALEGVPVNAMHASRVSSGWCVFMGDASVRTCCSPRHDYMLYQNVCAVMCTARCICGSCGGGRGIPNLQRVGAESCGGERKLASLNYATAAGLSACSVLCSRGPKTCETSLKA